MAREPSRSGERRGRFHPGNPGIATGQRTWFQEPATPRGEEVMKIDWQRAPKELGPAIADDGIAVLQDRQAVSRVLLEAGNRVDYFTCHPDPTARFEELRWHGDPVQVG